MIVKHAIGMVLLMTVQEMGKVIDIVGVDVVMVGEWMAVIELTLVGEQTTGLGNHSSLTIRLISFASAVVSSLIF